MNKLFTRHHQKGFSLVETMMGMCLVSILLMSTVAAIPGLRQVVIKSEIAKMGNSLGNNKIEYFRTMSFEDIKDDLLPNSPLKETVTVNEIEYSITTTIKPYAIGGSSSDAIEVYVTVEWATRTDHKQTSSNWTIFTRNGLSDKQFIQTS